MPTDWTQLEVGDFLWVILQANKACLRCSREIQTNLNHGFFLTSIEQTISQAPFKERQLSGWTSKSCLLGWIAIDHSLEAESQALIKGMKFIKEMGLRHVIN